MNAFYSSSLLPQIIINEEYVDTTKDYSIQPGILGKMCFISFTFYAKKALQSGYKYSVLQGLPITKLRCLATANVYNETDKTYKPVTFAIANVYDDNEENVLYAGLCLWFAGSVKAGERVRIGISYPAEDYFL